MKKFLALRLKVMILPTPPTNDKIYLLRTYKEGLPMPTVTLGRTGITTDRNGFGALPVQRVAKEEAAKLLRRAYDGGITFFDTARAYTDSEEKMGYAMNGIRNHIFIATKTAAETADAFWKDLETSLSLLKTDYIDVYQFHNPDFCPRPGDGTGLYEAALKAKEQGKIRFIGLTNHRLAVAREAIESDLYDTLQFPFCYLSTGPDVDLVKGCREKNIGFIAMKALSGGLITNAAAAYAFAAQFDNVLPIWGIQKEHELEEFLRFVKEPPSMTEEIQALIERDRLQLAGSFCRGCGYCMPCPVGIEINTCARMSLLLRRSPSASHLSEEGKARMMAVKECLHCGQCVSKCPYGLDTPELLQRNLKDYEEILGGKVMTATNF